MTDKLSQFDPQLVEDFMSLDVPRLQRALELLQQEKVTSRYSGSDVVPTVDPQTGQRYVMAYESCQVTVELSVAYRDRDALMLACNPVEAMRKMLMIIEDLQRKHE